MNAARIHSFGPPGVVVVEDVPMPSPGPGEVLGRVVAAGVAPWNAIIREGKSKVSHGTSAHPGFGLLRCRREGRRRRYRLCSGDRIKYWGKWGAFWGGLWGLLVGSAFLIIPGIGPVVAAGSIVASIVAALEGAVVVGGLSALGAGLFSLGIPKDSVVKYETSIKAGKFVLVAHGSSQEVAKARDMLKTSGAEQIDSYQPSTGATRGVSRRSSWSSVQLPTTVSL